MLLPECLTSSNEGNVDWTCFFCSPPKNLVLMTFKLDGNLGGGAIVGSFRMDGRFVLEFLELVDDRADPVDDA